ncbi:MAG TPA: hypothetical protein VLE97_06255 [Gaiellaceae bacterium]|nr:hypothetical protein [Gaiellaceae bacterium]
MSKTVRFLVELVGLFVLGAGLLLGVILAANQVADEKVRYFVIGYYVAVHANLVRWIWKSLGIEKASTP